MAAKHERTFKMMESFMSLHNEGHSIDEIAKMFDLSSSTVYKKLGEIAMNAGVNREDLLKKPFTADHSGRNFALVQPIDRTAIQQSIDSLSTEINNLNNEIEKIVNNIEVMNKLLGEELQ